jgi:hypothetical protein
MNFIQSDDELAAVLGHEITHAALRHLAWMDRESKKTAIFEIPLILAAILKGGQGGQALATGYQLGKIGQMSGWTVKAEKAADYGGFQLMQKSPYNSSACLTVVERLAQLERNRPDIDWGIFRTHPPSEERVAAILKDFKVGHVRVQRSAVTTSLTVNLKKVDSGVEAWFGNKLLYTFTGEDARQRAEIAEKRLNSFFDNVPPMYDVQTNGSKVLGGRELLIDVEPQDAARAKVPPSQLADKTAAQIKGALLNLSFQVWQPTLP